MRWVALMALGLVVGCFAPKNEGADDLYMDDDVPAGSCMSDTGPCDTDANDDGDSTAANAGTCESTTQCGVGQTCMATFDGDIGEFECSSACVDDMDEESWCLDDAACCNSGSVCSERGYCASADATSAGAEESGTSDSTGAATTSTGTGG